MRWAMLERERARPLLPHRPIPASRANRRPPLAEGAARPRGPRAAAAAALTGRIALAHRSRSRDDGAAAVPAAGLRGRVFPRRTLAVGGVGKALVLPPALLRRPARA